MWTFYSNSVLSLFVETQDECQIHASCVDGFCDLDIYLAIYLELNQAHQILLYKSLNSHRTVITFCPTVLDCIPASDLEI